MRLTAKAREIILQLKKERKALRQSALQKDETLRVCLARAEQLAREQSLATQAARQARRTAEQLIVQLDMALDALRLAQSPASRELCAEALKARTDRLVAELREQTHALQLYMGAEPVSDSYALADPRLKA